MNPSVESTHKWPVMRTFDVSFYKREIVETMYGSSQYLVSNDYRGVIAELD